MHMDLATVKNNTRWYIYSNAFKHLTLNLTDFRSKRVSDRKFLCLKFFKRCKIRNKAMAIVFRFGLRGVKPQVDKIFGNGND
jgi:hypothetical protein